MEENHTTLKDEKLKDFVPPYLLPKLAEVLAKATSFQADVALVMESGVGNFKKMKAAEKEVKLALSDAKKKSVFSLQKLGAMSRSHCISDRVDVQTSIGVMHELRIASNILGGTASSN